MSCSITVVFSPETSISADRSSTTITTIDRLAKSQSRRTRPRPLCCACSHQQPRIPEYHRRLLASLWRVCSLLFWLAPDPSSTRAPSRRSAAVKAARPGLQRALEDQADDVRLIPSRLCFLFLVADGQGFWRLCASTPRGRATPPLLAWFYPSPVTVVVGQPLSLHGFC